MKSNKYWSNRAKERMMLYHNDSDDAIEVITDAYEKAIENIDKEIKKIFNKFGKNGTIPIEDIPTILGEKLPSKEIEEFRELLYSIEDKDTQKYLLSKINSPAYQARITRLESLKEKIYLESKKIATIEYKVSNALYTDTINQAFYRSIFDIQKGIGIGLSFEGIPTHVINEILKNPWSGKHFSERIWGNTDILAEQFTKIMLEGFMTGKSIDKMSRELRKTMDVGRYVATRLVRTELTYMANAGEIESYKELEIEKYIYIATLDLRTSKVCQGLDREVFEVSKAVPGENLPPMHPNCRSSTRSYISKEELAKIKRRARDPITGKTYLVPGDMKYKEWYEKYVKE